MSEVPLINIPDISKPATVLIEKISDAIGGVAKPYQIKRVARAEAEAQRIRAEEEIAIADLRLRAANRFIEEEMRKQYNMEAIIAQAVSAVREDSSPDEMEDDWIVNFFEKCRTVSDGDMQSLWSRILAGQANNPRLILA